MSKAKLPLPTSYILLLLKSSLSQSKKYILPVARRNLLESLVRPPLPFSPAPCATRQQADGPHSNCKGHPDLSTPHLLHCYCDGLSLHLTFCLDSAVANWPPATPLARALDYLPHSNQGEPLKSNSDHATAQNPPYHFPSHSLHWSTRPYLTCLPVAQAPESTHLLRFHLLSLHLLCDSLVLAG